MYVCAVYCLFASLLNVWVCVCAIQVNKKAKAPSTTFRSKQSKNKMYSWQRESRAKCHGITSLEIWCCRRHGFVTSRSRTVVLASVRLSFVVVKDLDCGFTIVAFSVLPFSLSLSSFSYRLSTLLHENKFLVGFQHHLNKFVAFYTFMVSKA